MRTTKAILTDIARRHKKDANWRAHTPFIPLSRIRRAKYEQSVNESVIKREKLNAFSTHESGCRCGSKECLANAMIVQRKSITHIIPKRKKTAKKLTLKARVCIHFSGKAT